MHDIRFIRENTEAFTRALARRPGVDAGAVVRELEAIDLRRRAIIRVSEENQAERNRLSKQIGELKRSKQDASSEMGRVAKLKEEAAGMDREVAGTEQELRDALAKIPNLPLDEVPEGADEHGNKEHHVFGEKPAPRNWTKPHYDLGENLKQMDFDAAAKMSGARFVVLKSGIARMARALGQFMLDTHTGVHGYTEVNPPLLVRDDAMFGTAQLPKFRDDQYSVYGYEESEGSEEKDPKTGSIVQSATGQTLRPLGWLIPTAEVSLTNLVRESILDSKELPLRFTALTPCFRAEAGAAGRDTRGMIRQHQFEKVELVSITTPDKSKEEHERMLACAEEVLRRLNLHYRVMTLCTGDMGFASQKTWDIEVWMPGQGEGGAFREISSCSVCGDFQARRMNARYRGADGKPAFVHTLNGSGTAVGRALIAVMENYQQEDGSIAVPDVLQPYMGGMKSIQKAG